MGNAQKVDELLRASCGTWYYPAVVRWIIEVARDVWVPDYVDGKIDITQLGRRLV
jgi:hypothetical protein